MRVCESEPCPLSLPESSVVALVSLFPEQIETPTDRQNGRQTDAVVKNLNDFVDYDNNNR